MSVGVHSPRRDAYLNEKPSAAADELQLTQINSIMSVGVDEKSGLIILQAVIFSVLLVAGIILDRNFVKTSRKFDPLWHTVPLLEFNFDPFW